MKNLQNSSSFLRGLAAGLLALSSLTAAHAAPYASAIQVNGTNVTFILNETAGSVTITYGDGTTNGSFNGVTTGTNLAAGAYTFGVPGTNTTYAISVFTEGTGAPFQYSTNSAQWVGGWPQTIRAVAANACPTNGPSFGRVYVATTGSSATRQYGIYGVTPDLQSNSFFGGNNTNAICTSTATAGPFAPAIASGNGGFGSGPYRLYCAPDGGVYCTDAEDAGANCYYFSNNFQITNTVFSITGRIAGQNANQHGNINDIAIEGSAAAGNLRVWTADNGLYVPAYFANTNDPHFPGGSSPAGPYGLGQGGVGNFGGAQETEVGDANEIYRYDLGSGAYPIGTGPNYAATLMLGGGFEDSQVCGVALNPVDTNFVYAMARRDNFSDGDIQVFSASTGQRLYTSLHGTASSPYDIFATSGTIGGTALGAYGGVRISPDGRFMGVYADTQIFIVCNLTNGIPDESSVQLLSCADAGDTTGRHFGWDAADNLYSADSSGASINGNSALGLIHAWDLGITATCVTKNDLTGNNGSFQLILPSASATVVNNGDASQNYGTPLAGYFQVSIGTANTSPVALGFTLGGTATNVVNYAIGIGNIGSGIIVATNGTGGTITFPPGQVTANIPVTPTASPAVGPTLTVTLKVSPGTNYITGSPAAGTVNIANTGAQFLFVTASPLSTSMSRSISNDYAEFIINRWGDTNGPSNSVGNVTPHAYTITGIQLTNGSALNAIYGVDYVAGPQRLVAGQTPMNGSAGLTINPGDTQITCLVGNPVPHTNVLIKSLTNNTIVASIPSPGTALDGTTYTGYGTNTNAVVTELDNRVGAEVVIWSDPLTNSAASTYTVTFASTNLANGSNTLPVVLSPYLYTNGGANNGSASSLGSPSNNFDVELGFPVASENAFESAAGVGFFGPAYSPPVSPVMAANGWSNVMRVTVDKPSDNPSICGVNVYPTTNSFFGNYALRFDMYLAIWSGALNNVAPLNFPREFAAFGINHQGTNCDWRLSLSQQFPIAGINNPTNADGIWFSIDAGDGSLTPADFDQFSSPPVPNQGTSDFASLGGSSLAGAFKRPPFAFTDGDSDGAPINQWVNVSVETTGGTNVIMYVDGTPVLGTGSGSASIGLTNYATSFPSTWSGGSNINSGAGLWTNGVPMLGYLQPYNSESDESAFVYYSNLRVVELSPYITQQPASTLVSAGTNVTLTATASYATQPGMTNVWHTSANGTPAAIVTTDTSAGTNFPDSLTLNSVTTGSNYFTVFSDSAGTITNAYPAVVEVITGPANQAVGAGFPATFSLTASGSAAPIYYQWMTNGVSLVNGAKYTGVSTATLTVANSQVSDAAGVTYSCLVSNLATNLFGVYVMTNLQALTTPAATLIVNPLAPTNAVVSPAAQTVWWGSNAVFTVTADGTQPLSYTWLRNGTNLVGAHYSGTNTATLTILGVTQADGTNGGPAFGTYSVLLTNTLGSTNSSSGVLAVFVPQPGFKKGGVSLSSGNVLLTFSSPNPNDTTNAFTLLSSPVATGPYTSTTATFSGTYTNFQISVPETTNGTMFYQLQHAN